MCVEVGRNQLNVMQKKVAVGESKEPVVKVRDKSKKDHFKDESLAITHG